MPPLKAIEQAQFGGVDSRSNPVVMPQERFLRLRNWRPRPDGHLELRDGYTLITPVDADASTPGLGGPHSITPYIVATPAGPSGVGTPISGFSNGDICVFFWRGGDPFLRRVSDGHTVNLASASLIKGNPIASANRYQYALGKDGFLYMHNGTDAKFFDGAYLRDIGLPTLSPSQLAGIAVSAGFSGPSLGSTTITWGAAGTGTFNPSGAGYLFYYVFLDQLIDQLAPSSPIAAPVGSGTTSNVTLSGLPISPVASAVGLVAINYGGAAGASYLTTNYSVTGTMTPFAGHTQVTVTCAGPHSLSEHDVVTLVTGTSGPPWHSNGPFTVSVTGFPANQFAFHAPTIAEAQLYTTSGDFFQLIKVPHSSSSVTITTPYLAPGQGSDQSSDGTILLPYVDDFATGMLPASAIGGAQPGYQFYGCIYNPSTGHVGNRTPLGIRLNNSADCVVNISSLPDISLVSAAGASKARYGYSARNVLWGSKGGTPPITLPTHDPEWRILIGRTGDGGEVPYACIDADGNWITTNSPSESSISISSGKIDGNAELPTENYPPPAFASFWREGDRMCGTVALQPFVFRSASELDATTGIFVGDPAQAWSPIRVETFPTAQAVIGGFGFMQESWVFTKSDCAQLSELSGEVAWNGPYNFGIAGPYAFDKGWNSLPYWVSHDKQLCTMMPGANGPIPISTEYEAALLARIGDAYLSETEVVYFRDPARMIEVLRIKCADSTRTPFVIVHDFNLRDDSSPYGQGYEDAYLGPLGSDFTAAWIRDQNGHGRIWAGAQDQKLYQLYTGGDDAGNYFTADGVMLRYIGGERTAVKTLEWYGDPLIQWFIYETMLDAYPDPNFWVNLTYEARPVPGDSGNGHFMADLNRPEMTHCYLWAQLLAHPFDGLNPADPMALSVPIPHIPLETYGRLYLSAPVLGDSRGR